LLALVGALAGAGLYLLFRIVAEGLIGSTTAVVSTVFAVVFFTSLLALTGPMDLPRAAWRAAVQALAVAALVLWASMRFESAEGLLGAPLVIVSVLVLTLIPLPFILAADGPGWRDYPALFGAAWGIVMRSTVAWVFVAILWAVIFLSHVLLGLVGVDVIGRVVLMPPVVWLITGTAFGLAMAVALELADVVSAYLVLRLLRMLVPVVLAVMGIFLVAVAIRGGGTALGGFSTGAILLLMSGLAATLVSAAVDQWDAEAARTPFLQRAAQALAALLILPAALAGWAVWQRVALHGWTPDRLFAASVAVLALGYGATYLHAVLRRHGWMERIRQANIWMALALMALAALWLTPVLNPERISAQSQMARFQDGRVTVQQLDIEALLTWGRAGAGARARLEDLARTDPALAARLAAPESALPAPPADTGALRASLKAELPVQPQDQAAFRDRVLDLAGVIDLEAWSLACAARLELGGPGCVMVVADFLPGLAGPEALLILNSTGGYLTYLGLAINGSALRVLEVDSGAGGLVNFEEGARLIAELQQAMPSLRPVPRNELQMPLGGEIGLKP
jgi:hypothetical protein